MKIFRTTGPCWAAFCCFLVWLPFSGAQISDHDKSLFENEFDSLEESLKKPAGKQKEKDADALDIPQMDVPLMSEQDNRLYNAVVSLLPDVESAIEFLEKVAEKRISKGSKDIPGPGIFYLWGNLLYRAERYEESLRRYELALAGFPAYRKACLEAGMAAYHLGDSEKAIGYLERGLASGGVGQEPHVMNLLGDLYRDSGQVEKAIQIYQEVIVLDASDLHAHIQLVRLHYERGEFDQTLEYALRAIALGGGNKDLYLAIARIYEARGHLSAALSAIENVRFFDPSGIPLRHFHLDLLNRLGQQDAAMAIAREILREDDTDVDAWRYLAQAHALRKETAEAISAYQAMCLLGENNVEIQLALASLYSEENLPDLSARALIGALAQSGNDEYPGKIIAFARGLIGNPQFEQAMPLLDSLEQWARNLPGSEVQRTLTLLRAHRQIIEGKSEDARLTLAEYIERFPGDALARMLMGDVETSANDYPAARLHLARAALDEGLRPEAMLKLGLLELREGNISRSIDRLVEAYHLRPTDRLRRYILKICRHYQSDPSIVFPEI